MQQLRTLQTRKPFPNQQNLETTKATLEEYVAEIGKLRDEVTKLELPVPEISPESFQDNLRQVVSEIEKRAAEVGTQLPKDFYMGFDNYKSNLPTPRTAGLLSRQLKAISIVINRLLELKVDEIVTVTRPNLPEEASAQGKETTPPIVTKSPFEVVFRSDQGKARMALNTIESSRQVFFILRSVMIENSQLLGPSRYEVTGTATPPPETAGTGEDEGGARIGNLKIIVGRESVTVGMQLEMATFHIPELKL